MTNHAVTIEPLSWRYRIEPLASGGVVITVPCHKPIFLVVFLSIFLTMWCGIGIVGFTISGSPIPLVMTLFGACTVGSVLASVLTGVEYVTITPSVLTYKWQVLCFNSTKNYGTKNMGRLHLVVKAQGRRNNQPLQQLVGFQYGGSVVEVGRCLAPGEVEPFMHELAKHVPDHAKPMVQFVQPQQHPYPMQYAQPQQPSYPGQCAQPQQPPYPGQFAQPQQPPYPGQFTQQPLYPGQFAQTQQQFAQPQQPPYPAQIVQPQQPTYSVAWMPTAVPVAPAYDSHQKQSDY